MLKQVEFNFIEERKMNNIINKYLKMVLVLSLSFGVNAALAALPYCNPKIKASTPDADFIDNQNGTITHKTTGLMWKKCPEGLKGDDCESGSAFKNNWKSALALADKANTDKVAGYNNWRVPNIIELNSIVEYSCSAPAINKRFFPNTPDGVYVSSSPFHAYDGLVWSINFVTGKDNSSYASKAEVFYIVRLVRTRK